MTLLMPQRNYGVDTDGAPGGDPAGYCRGESKKQGHGREGDGVVYSDAYELSADKPAKEQADDYSDCQPGENEAQGGPDHHAYNVSPFCAQGHADADFVGPPRGRVGQDAVNADRNQNQANRSEDGHEHKAEVRTGVEALVDVVRQRPGGNEGNARICGPDSPAHGVHHGCGIL